MLDIKKDFTESYELLKHHKKIVVPTLLSILVPLILIILFLNMSGLSPLLKELRQQSIEFDQQKVDYLFNKSNMQDQNYSMHLANYLARGEGDSNYDTEFDKYLDKRGYNWNRYSQLINFKNIMLLVAFVLIGVLSSFYFSCMSYAIISLAIKNQDISAGNIFRATNKFLFKLFSLSFLTTFIFWIPVIIVLAIIVSLFFLNLILGVFSIPLFIILLVLYLVFVCFRLFFAMPAMYVEGQGPVKSIVHSFHLTKGHFIQVVVLFFIVYGMQLFINSFAGSPLYGTYANVLFDASAIKIAISAIILVIFLLLESILLTLKHIFLFYAYIDFKHVNDAVKGSK